MNVRESGDVTVLNVQGNVVSGDLSLFRETCKNLLITGKKKIVLNLAEVSYIDTIGIAELLSWMGIFCSQHRGGLKLLCPTKKVVALLHITKTYTTFEIFNDEVVAIASFQ